jgi:hypothetical protein
MTCDVDQTRHSTNARVGSTGCSISQGAKCFTEEAKSHWNPSHISKVCPSHVLLKACDTLPLYCSLPVAKFPSTNLCFVLLNSNVKNGYLHYGRRHTADSPRINEHVTEGEMRMFVHKLAKLKVTFDIHTHTHITITTCTFLSRHG